ncbi:MAG TPA: response regulator [Hyphomicrobiaceae bacterium]|nr:response regulator [Hyphomicrobiaceae bacterium]
MRKPIVLAVVDDDPSVLDSTVILLRAQGLTVHAARSAEALLAAITAGTLKPDCIVCDVLLPGASGIDLIEALAAHGTRAPVVLITGHGDIRMAVSAIKMGASDFIEKPFAIEDLVASIDAAVARSRAAEDAARERSEIEGRVALLSARQREVMDLVVEGYSSKQIGLKLGISPRTVETYRLQIMDKMGAGSVAALVRMTASIRR